MRVSALALWIVVAFLSHPAAAATPSEAPLRMMAKLESFVGVWDATLEMTSDGGETWTAGPTKRLKAAFRLNGLALADTPLETVDGGFSIEHHITYDQYRDVYRAVALDDTWGVMDVYEGRLEGDRLVLDNLRAETFFPSGNGDLLAYRLTFTIGADERSLFVDSSADRGESWSPAFRSRMVRVD